MSHSLLVLKHNIGVKGVYDIILPSPNSAEICNYYKERTNQDIRLYQKDINFKMKKILIYKRCPGVLDTMLMIPSQISQ